MTSALFHAPLFGARPFSQLCSRLTVTDSLGASFQKLCRWLIDGTPVGLKPMQQTSLRHRQPARVPVLKPQQLGGGPSAVRLTAARAVRVVRVQESGQPRTSVGRMVISGRMADVCAELDRLAAQEAALHPGGAEPMRR